MKTNYAYYELIKRYIYLYQNKELILSRCIKYDPKINNIDLKINKHNLKIIKRSFYGYDGTKEALLDKYLTEQQHLINNQYYLPKSIDKETAFDIEEFLFTDDDIENTNLYQIIERIKKDPFYSKKAQELINIIKYKRLENRELRSISAFTVWKILTYVRNNNINNKKVLNALDKYYNLDRYIITKENYESGYKLSEEDIKDKKLYSYPAYTKVSKIKFKDYYNAVILTSIEKKYEAVDNYFSFDWINEFNGNIEDNYSKSDFMKKLAKSKMLDCETKAKVYKRVKNGGK